MNVVDVVEKKKRPPSPENFPLLVESSARGEREEVHPYEKMFEGRSLVEEKVRSRDKCGRWTLSSVE